MNHIKVSNNWQNSDDVLLRYGKRLSHARKKYLAFVDKALSLGRQPELTGGGLVRSMGGWAAVVALRKAKVLMKGDERILGDTDFVENVLKQNQEAYEKRNRLKSKGVDLDAIAQRVSQLLELPIDQVWAKGKYRKVVEARSLLCFWAVRELGMSATSLAPIFNVSGTAISKSVLRGETFARENNYEL